MRDLIGIRHVSKTLENMAFFALLRNPTRISRGHVHKLNTSFYSDAFLNQFKLYLKNKHFDSPNFTRIYLLSIKEKKLNNFFLMKALMMPITLYTHFT